jgi:hypothetical protein
MDSDLSAITTTICKSALEKKKDLFFISALEELAKAYVWREDENDKILADFFAVLKTRLETGNY